MRNLKLKFRGKILLIMILSIIIISGAVQFAIYSVVSDVVLKVNKSELKSKAEGVTNNIDIQVRMDQFVTKLLAEGYLLKSALKDPNSNNIEASNKKLKEVSEENKKFEGLLVLDATGKVISAADENVIGIDMSQRDYFKTAMKGESSITNVMKSKITGDPVFVLAQPVMSDGKIVGALAIANSMTYIYNNIIKPVTAGDTGYVFMNDDKGIVIAHPDKNLVLDKDFPKRSTATTDVVKHGEGEMRYWWDPINDYKISQISKTANGWYVVLTVPESELLHSLDIVNMVSFIGGAILIILISTIIYIVIGTLAKLITALNELIMNLAVGKVAVIKEHKTIRDKALKRGDEFTDMVKGVEAIQQYLTEMSTVATKLAQKDLNVSINIKSSEDILGNSFDLMIKNFNRAFTQVATTVEQVDVGATQVSSASQSLSTGATQQVASIEEISASVADLNNQTRRNAENAKTARELTVTANNDALNGQAQMAELSEAMTNMSGRASEVQKIIKTIDDIAFQTNLLALNAAVEAARAGQHGKGFAVVAEEVRNLAARSAKAAGETAELIDNVVNEINHGNEATAVTAESLNKIAAGISESTAIIAEIATAASEQSSGMEQMEQGLRQIEVVTQSNTASSEETASASEEMSGMSTELKNLISEFKLAPDSNDDIDNDRNKPKGIRRKRVKTALPAPSSRNADVIQPSDVIKLDDNEFGKF